ncbi:MAG: class I tRNA ligase family protein, partial [Caldilineaceae bacterium]|nr:class I tRNA ligase family protein [Caldilineaceae bacterium]
RDLMLMMAPIFPHIADELWHRQGNTSSVHRQRWPIGDPEKAREEEIIVVVQINGKVRDKLAVAPGTPGEELERQALALSNIVKWMDGKQARKIIVVPDKLVNIVMG